MHSPFTLGFALIAVAVQIPGWARGDDTAADRAASWGPVIVLTGNAQVFSGDQPGPKVAPGTILYISQRRQEWLLVPRYNQWLHEQHARSLPAASTYLDDQIAKQPTGELHHFRAIVLSELGRTDAAVRDFDAAINAGVKSSNVFLNRGLAWGRAGEMERAFADFAMAIQLDDTNSHAYFNRGVLNAQSGMSALAIQDFDRAIQFEPSYAEAYNNRGVAHESLGDRQRALADYNRAVELRPRYPGALTSRANLRQLEGKFSDAIADYGAALRMAPDAHPTLNDLAWLLATCPDENVRNAAAAFQYAERANALTRRQDSDYLDTLAAAAAAAGEYDLAVASMDAAIQVAPEASQPELQQRRTLYLNRTPYVDPNMVVGNSSQAPEALPSVEEATPVTE